MRRKRLWVAVLLLLVLILSLPLLLNLEMFRGPVHAALERELGRKVELAALTGTLLPRPSIAAEGVVVHDDPAFGHEPFLYAERVDCRVPVRVFWTGRLECSELYFLRPTINLVRAPGGAWNVAALLVANQTSSVVEPPPVSATEGRLNVKFGFSKQVYILSDVRLRLEPRPQGRWQINLEATPTRVDRRLGETGRLRLQGEAGRATEFTAVPFFLDAGLEDGSLAQWWTLFRGEELPVTGSLGWQLRFEGTPAEWTTRGRLTVTNLRRWDLVASPRSPQWQVEVNLRRLTGADALLLEEAVVRGQQSEVRLAGRVERPFGERQWELEANSARLALDELAAQVASLKAEFSSSVRCAGEAQATLQIAGPVTAWKGIVAAPAGATVRLPGVDEPVQLSDLRLRLNRGRLTLEPLTLRFGRDAVALNAELRLDAAARPYRLRWRSAQVELPPLVRAAEALGWNLFRRARWDGRAQFDLEWRGEMNGSAASWPESGWQGTFEARDARFQPPEFNHPLEIPALRLAWKGVSTDAQPVVMRLGENTLSVSAQRRAPDEPWSFTLTGARFRLADVNNLVNPAQRSFFERLTRGESRPPPEWSRGKATGKLRFDELAAGPFRLAAVEADAAWQAGLLSLQRLRFRAYAGRFDGSVQSDFRVSPPRHSLAGSIRQMAVGPLLADSTRLGDAFTGLVSAEVALESAGAAGSDLRRNLRGRVVGGINHGTLTRVDVLGELARAAGHDAGQNPQANITTMQSLAGEFQVGEEKVEMKDAQLIVDGAALQLTGTVGFDGRLDLNLRGAPLRLAGREPAPVAVKVFPGSYRVSGSLARPEFQLSETPPAAEKGE
ncbi:MAG TPA: AsmA family protein [Candidatus Xenobia bacterium]|nr:AsmA family protein [Candidatus Xenobia bacterium]